jgi:hypothetical protein
MTSRTASLRIELRHPADTLIADVRDSRRVRNLTSWIHRRTLGGPIGALIFQAAGFLWGLLGFPP